MKYPSYRPRRMRRSEGLRKLLRETEFSLSSLIMPYFVKEEGRGKDPIEAMPGQFRWSPDSLLEELEEIQELGLGSILLFGLPQEKDEVASQAFAQKGVIQEIVRLIKKNFPELIVITDVCLCGYTVHGHCGILSDQGEIDNDASLKILQRVAVSHAEAGADIVAPSDMMDGRVRAIRDALDAAGFKSTPILSYAAKYASSFYGPFREAAHSSPLFGDRKSYQMDPANREEAMREIQMDIEEGADIVMVKPALAYLDVIRDAKQKFQFPLAAYNVSGEYSMIKAAAQAGWLDEKKVVFEILTAIRRAGAQLVLTYHAKEVSQWLKEAPNSSARNLKV
ncbi:MAG: porphobilinogen synthase [Candidatus Omnitrophica bacterium]|nr:porphobilinogen synthase [Candidatus Omnitrophota bacterium]